MKKTLILVLVLGFGLVGCSKKEAPVEPVPTEDGIFKISEESLQPEFESVDYGFRVKGPEGWVKAVDELGMLVTYLKPGDPESFQENITIAREVKGDFNLADYVTGTAGQIAEFFPESEVTSRETTTLASREAEKLHYVFNIEGMTLETEQVIVERPTEFMVFTFMATPAQFEGTYAEFTKVLDSVQLVGDEN